MCSSSSLWFPVTCEINIVVPGLRWQLRQHRPCNNLIMIMWRRSGWNDTSTCGITSIITAQEPSTQLSEGTTSSKCVAYVPPNGFVFVEMLRKEQATANTASEFVCPKKRKHRQLDTWLQSLEDRPRHWMLLPILFISSESCKYLCVNNDYMIYVIVI